MADQHEERLSAIHLLRAGHSTAAVAAATRPQPPVGTQMAPALRERWLGWTAQALTCTARARSALLDRCASTRHPGAQ